MNDIRVISLHLVFVACRAGAAALAARRYHPEDRRVGLSGFHPRQVEVLISHGAFVALAPIAQW